MAAALRRGLCQRQHHEIMQEFAPTIFAGFHIAGSPALDSELRLAFALVSASELPYRCKKVCKVVKPGSTNSVMKKLFLALFVATLALPLAAQTKTLLNLDKTGVAIQGYDTVAFFTDGK